MKRALHFLIAIALICTTSAFAAETGDLDKIFGQKGYSQDDVVKYSFPRSDLKVKSGEVPLEAGFALGSWAAFKSMNGESIMMGDLVLTSGEIAAVIKKCAKSEIQITAVHNHLMATSQPIWYLHFSGKGDSAKLAEALKSVLSKTATPMKPSKPKESKTISLVQNRANTG